MMHYGPPGGQRFDILIVGGGHGGAQAAISLRQEGFAGTIAIVTDELDLPYERPPLSKEYLSGGKSFERMLIRPAAFWSERGVTIMPGRRVDAVDPERHLAATADGDEIGYDSLIWAAGGTPRRLTCRGADLKGLHTVRTRADVDQLAEELKSASRIAVVGGGYIGLEAAAVLTKLGKRVHLLEAMDRVLARVAGEELSRFFEARHRANGVEISLGVSVECIQGDQGRVTAVTLADGTAVAAEMVVVGIGIVPAVQPLLDAGAEGGNGVVVDGQCRTSLPCVYAIGDCALHRNSHANGAYVRLESVQNATDQARIAAKSILGQDAAYDALPWFWSNQYDVRLQTVGLSNGHDQRIMRGDAASGSFSLLYLRQGRVIALDCVNMTRDYVQGRKLISSGRVFDPELLADPAIRLKDL
ncbi:MAG TPA: FAD-dependent oxidoreductase [Allosphingosinicella sp.]